MNVSRRKSLIFHIWHHFLLDGTRNCGNLGACSLVNPLKGSGQSSIESMLIMNGTALLLFFFLLFSKKLYRWQGIIFLLLYAAFTAWSIICVK